jgi:hypothetical protein
MIDFPGAVFTQATGINASGSIVGGWLDPDGTDRAFVRAHGVFTSVDYPGALATRAFGISASGEIAGDYVDAGGTFHGFALSGQ